MSSKDLPQAEQFFSFNEFNSYEISDLKISVGKINESILTTTYEINLFISSKEQMYSVSKRYTEFHGLWDTVTEKYKNFNYPEFPSKIQIFNKNETRKKFFDVFLRTILNLGKKHPEIKRDIMKILFEFLFPDAPEVKSEVFKKITKLSYDNNFPDSNEIFNLEERKLKIKENSKNNEDMNKDGWEIEYKIESNDFRKGFLKIKNQVLFIHNSVFVNNFFFLTPLYKIQYIIHKCYPIDSSKTFRINENEIKKIIEENCSKKLHDINYEMLIFLKHDNENSKFVLKFLRDYPFSKFSSFLQILNNSTIRQLEPTQFIDKIDETNLNIYGKFYFKLVDVSIKNYDANIYALLSLNPYKFQSKNVLSKNTFNFDQMFHFPIHNKFDILYIEFFSQSNSKFLTNQTSKEKFAEYKLILPHFLNQIDPFKKTYQVDLELKDYDILNSKEFEQAEKKMTFNFRFENFSSIKSLISKSNKNIIEEMNMNEIDDHLKVIMIVIKRLVRFLLLIKEFKIKYKEIFQWKYPNFSIFILVILNLYCLFSSTENIIIHILILFGAIIFYFSPLNEKYFKKSIDVFFFNNINSNYHCSGIKLKDEEEDDEIKNINYLSEKVKKKTSLINQIIEPFAKFKEYKTTYKKVLKKFMNIISFFEKLKNLFFWTDPLVTFCALVLILILIIIIYNITFKMIFFFFIWDQFISKFNHLERKYINNLEIGRIVLKAGHQEWVKETRNKKKDIQFVDSDIDKITIYDDKYRIFIKNFVERNLKVIIGDDIIKEIKQIGELHDCIAKCSHLLKLKKDHDLYNQCLDNKLIYEKKDDIDDILGYFIFNIKSDYYISKYDLKY